MYVCMCVCYVVVCYVMSCYVMLCYVMLCYVMLCYAVVCYVMLYFLCVDGFRVKELGYKSLGQRVPNFPNSAGQHGLGSFGKIGNLEIYTSSNVEMSPFHKSCWATWAGVIWEIGKSIPLAISQVPKSCWAIWAGVIWEIGNVYLFQFRWANLGHMGWGHLGNWDLGGAGRFYSFVNTALGHQSISQR